MAFYSDPSDKYSVYTDVQAVMVLKGVNYEKDNTCINDGTFNGKSHSLRVFRIIGRGC